MSDQDHREAPRVPRPFLIRYRSAADGRGAWSVSPLHDFSELGARFMSELSCIVGDRLELQLGLPLVSRPLIVGATVAWTKLGKLGLVEVGVTFELMDASVQQALGLAVGRFVQEERR